MTSRLLQAAVGVATTAYLDAKYGLGTDLRLGGAMGKAGISHAFRALAGKKSIASFFEDSVQRHPDHLAYIYQGRQWTWKEAQLEVNRLAHYLLSLGLKPGDRIAVFMHNSAHFVYLWLACMTINVVPAFINNSLTGPSLVHCVKVGRAKIVFYEAVLEAPLLEAHSALESTTEVRRYVCLDDGVPVAEDQKGGSASFSGHLPGSTYLGPADLKAQPSRTLPAEKYRKDVEDMSIAALIYTSGTTGLPKAALCSHGRMHMALTVWPTINRLTPQDRIFTPMPLYHSSAAFLCIGAAWNSGSTVIIGRRFSASKYWSEVRANDATVVQYIGEIARYLLAVPPHPDDKNHRVRLAYGNGMRPDVWEKFRERYGVRDIFEFYASSEGNGALLNYNTGPFGAGAIGRLGPLASNLRPDFRIIRVDPIAEDIFRDPKTGLCVECAPGETGEFVMRINSQRPASAFMGYADNPEATKKKVLADVFAKGDQFFRSGDLMKKDADGFFYFQDRIGDTFRWRSENVACAEVEAALGEVVDEANVYGVLVPNHDGRAGCAAIPGELASSVDWKLLASHARRRLPRYSVPLFVRVTKLAATGTMKHVKVSLRNEGIEHKACGSDQLLWLPPGSTSYVPFKPQDLEAIKAGKVKL